MTVLHVFVYCAVLIFIIAVLVRIIRIAKMPIHLRWELYPVPHEKGRAKYGGSMMEEVDWWTKPRIVDHIGMWRAMIPEMILLKGVWEHNRSLWFSSWTMHFGFYLLIGELGLLILSGILLLAGVSGTLIGFLAGFITILAWVGCVLGMIGMLSLFIRRLSDSNMGRFNNFSHYFNLLLLGAIYVTGFAWSATDTSYANRAFGTVAGWLSASSIPALPPIAYWHFASVLLFLIYFPFTYMTHAIVKYFTWHDIRWEDKPNLPGGKMAGKVAEMVGQPVTWTAAHIGGDGKKTWADIVANPVEMKPEEKAE